MTNEKHQDDFWLVEQGSIPVTRGPIHLDKQLQTQDLRGYFMRKSDAGPR
jgi:hypothetical protein